MLERESLGLGPAGGSISPRMVVLRIWMGPIEERAEELRMMS